MADFLVQTVIEFGTFMVIRGAASTSLPPSWKNAMQRDETSLIVTELAPPVAQLVQHENPRIVRLSGNYNKFIALTRFAFPSTSIVIDYSIHNVTPDIQNFIIAHELGHYKWRDPLIKLILECLIAALVVSLALKLSLQTTSIYSAALIAIPTIAIGTMALLLPVMRFIGKSMEFRADDFAARTVGNIAALQCLRELKARFSKSLTPEDLRSLEERLRRLESKTGSLAMSR